MVATDAWPAPASPGPLAATVRIPGSKSQAARALVLATLADGPTTLVGAPDARDTRLLLAACEALGVRATRAGDRLTLRPARPLRAPGRVDCGLAGTVERFVPPLAALADGETVFDGDPQARRRPIAPLLDALRRLGAGVEYLGQPDFLPFRVRGRGRLPAGTGAGAPRTLEVDARASSQFVSALLLAAPRCSEPLRIRATGSVPSAPHVAMTVDALRSRGVWVREEGVGTWWVRPGAPHGGTWQIEPDLSNAGPFLAAAMVCGGSVTVSGWPQSTDQPGDAWRGLLPRLGARVSRGPRGLTVCATGRAGLRGIRADLGAVGELAPTVAALAALAPTPSSLTGLAHLRGHETDRLAALAAEIRRAGGRVRELADGLEIAPAPLHAATFRTYHDHRMATFATILALALPGSGVWDVGTTAKTLPGFTRLWTGMLAQRARAQPAEPVGGRP